jgi:hypothetical protein
MAHEFDPSSRAKHVFDFEVDYIGGMHETYVSLFQGKDMSIYAIVAMWTQGPVLKISDEFVGLNSSADDVVAWINETAHTEVQEIREAIANPDMFTDDWKKSPNKLFAKAGLRLRKNLEYDERGSLMMLNELFKNDIVRIHAKRCPQLVTQLAYWRKQKGKITEGAGLAQDLCQLVARLKKANLLNTEEEKNRGYKQKQKQETDDEVLQAFLSGS